MQKSHVCLCLRAVRSSRRAAFLLKSHMREIVSSTTDNLNNCSLLCQRRAAAEEAWLMKQQRLVITNYAHNSWKIFHFSPLFWQLFDTYMIDMRVVRCSDSSHWHLYHWPTSFYGSWLTTFILPISEKNLVFEFEIQLWIFENFLLLLFVIKMHIRYVWQSA